MVCNSYVDFYLRPRQPNFVEKYTITIELHRRFARCSYNLLFENSKAFGAFVDSSLRSAHEARRS